MIIRQVSKVFTRIDLFSHHVDGFGKCEGVRILRFCLRIHEVSMLPPLELAPSRWAGGDFFALIAFWERSHAVKVIDDLTLSRRVNLADSGDSISKNSPSVSETG